MSYNKETGMYEGFIYKIYNDVNDKIYIGQTISDLQTRFSQHKYDAKKHLRNMYIHKAIRKYGIEHFNIKEIEKITESCKQELINTLNEREMYYIQKYNTTDSTIGYNLSIGGSNNGGDALRKICQYKITGELVRIWDSMTEAAEYYSVGKNAIFSACNGESNMSCGYIWRYIEDEFNTYPIKIKKRICKYSTSGDLLDIYYQEEFPKDYNIVTILQACRGKIKVHKGFVWRYEEDSFDKFDVKWAVNKNIWKSVSCYNDDRYICSYESIKLATIGVGLHSVSTIGAALKDHSKTAGGYTWYYANDPAQPDKTKIIELS